MDDLLLEARAALGNVLGRINVLLDKDEWSQSDWEALSRLVSAAEVLSKVLDNL